MAKNLLNVVLDVWEWLGYKHCGNSELSWDEEYQVYDICSKCGKSRETEPPLPDQLLPHPKPKHKIKKIKKIYD